MSVVGWFFENKVLRKAQAGREAGDGIEQAGEFASHLDAMAINRRDPEREQVGL